MTSTLIRATLTRRYLPLAFAAGTLLGACGGDSEAAGPPPGLSEEALGGWTLAQDKGCLSCHGRDAAGNTGPGWLGLAGSDRQLIDGTTVVADRTYLVRALVDPQAERVEGYSLLMPAAALDESEIEAIVDLIEEL